MADEDNRIDFTEFPVDFVRMGTTGQAHDNYPAPNTQARFDLMRQFLIGLLANQATDEEANGEPFEKRTGTLWFKKKAKLLDIFNGNGFDSLAKYIGVEVSEESEETEEGETLVSIRTVQDVLDELLSSQQFVAPNVIWSGFFTEDSDGDIPIPDEFLGYALLPNVGPIVHLDGLLVDPRRSNIISGNPAYVNISVSVESGQSYTVMLQHITEIKQEDVPAQG